MASEIKAPLQIAFKLGMEIERLSARMEQKAGISLAQWSVLIRLKDLPACPAQELAHAVGVHPSTLTQSLKRLEKKGYLVADKDPKDSRKKILSLTRAGAKRLDQALEVLQPWRDLAHPKIGAMESLVQLFMSLK